MVDIFAERQVSRGVFMLEAETDRVGLSAAAVSGGAYQV